MADWGGGMALDDRDESAKAIEDHVQRCLHFVQEHEGTLRSAEESLQQGLGAPPRVLQDVKCSLAATERVFPQDLIWAENALLRKVLLVFTFLCEEMEELRSAAEPVFYRKLLVFGSRETEYASPDDAAADASGLGATGGPECEMGRLLPILQDLSNFIDRSYCIAVNTVQQLAALYHEREALHKSTFSRTHLLPVFRGLAQVLEMLVTIDAIVEQNDELADAWGAYKRMVQGPVREAPSNFGVDEAKLQTFERMLVTLDHAVLGGLVFQNCIDQDFSEVAEADDDDLSPAGGRVDIKHNDVFLAEFTACLKLLLDEALAPIGTPAETNERESLVGIFALYALARRLAPPSQVPDPKFYKALWAVQKRVPVVTICGRLPWFPSDFLQRYAAMGLVKKLEPSSPETFRRQFLTQLDDAFPAEAKALHLQVYAWIVLMEGRFHPSLRHDANPNASLEARFSLMQKGVNLAARTKALATLLITLHLTLGVPMPKKVLGPLGLCVRGLKAVQHTSARHAAVIAETRPVLARMMAGRLLTAFSRLRGRLEAGKRFTDHNLDVVASLTAVETLLRGTDSVLSPTRLAALSLASCAALGESEQLKPAEAQQLRLLLKRVRLPTTFLSDLETATRTEFLFWNKELLPTMAATLYKDADQVWTLPYLLDGFGDGARLLGAAVHHPKPRALVDAYRGWLEDELARNFLRPLCTAAENDLRLMVHVKNMDHMSPPNPKERPDAFVRACLQLGSLRILGTVVDVRATVAAYLEETFYNLTTVTLHDWRTYAEMESLAKTIYGLRLKETFLPLGSLDAGLDVLQIMRNIHVFAHRFAYNMHQQVFVERRPDRGGRHLHAINAQSITASLRQHGLGVLNTAVNFTYQFLAQKFGVFSKFLVDDYIRSHLSRERRWFRKHKRSAEVNDIYPYQRAIALIKQVRKLGVNAAGKSFLDQFRELITEIGNALGYVRLVRCAGMYYCGEAVKFVPDLDHVINFERWAGDGKDGGKEGGDEEKEGGVRFSESAAGRGAGLSDETVRSARNLDGIIATLGKNFAEGTDYFKVLVNVFQAVLLNGEGEHGQLKNFYVIVPALLVQQVEANLIHKDAMYKSGRNRSAEASFTDDGFALGVAYVLTVLRQNADFAALHFFDGVRAEYALQEQQVKERMAAVQAKMKRKEAASRRFTLFSSKSQADLPEDDDDDDEILSQRITTVQTTAKRLAAHKKEMELLFFALNGASIFFRGED
uniref:WASH complex subunit 4 n=2 Tax=Phaeomonas parva TaxID=124430 RepID=A0A7S1TNP6_9STRA|mmetsp:Transcript_10671/g.32313  ORF Transcript_10671/g.32313 Transcript_10671/m.32313 type:complete len:1232 (+) Transcript_10671:131-3826(+)